jgi:hypothetical protein
MYLHTKGESFKVENVMSNFTENLYHRYLQGTLDVTGLTPTDFFFLQARLLRMKKYTDVQKLASIARNRKSFTGMLLEDTGNGLPASRKASAMPYVTPTHSDA